MICQSVKDVAVEEALHRSAVVSEVSMARTQFPLESKARILSVTPGRPRTVVYSFPSELNAIPSGPLSSELQTSAVPLCVQDVDA